MTLYELIDETGEELAFWVLQKAYTDSFEAGITVKVTASGIAVPESVVLWAGGFVRFRVDEGGDIWMDKGGFKLRTRESSRQGVLQTPSQKQLLLEAGYRGGQTFDMEFIDGSYVCRGGFNRQERLQEIHRRRFEADLVALD